MGTSGGGKDRMGVLPESGIMSNSMSNENDVTLSGPDKVGPFIPSGKEHNSGEVLLFPHSIKSKIKS